MFILALVFLGPAKNLPERRPWDQQLLRPLFLPHFIFAGYMGLSSVFHFLYSKGYVYFTPVGDPAPQEYFLQLAEAQQLYVLAHAALVHGIMLASRYRAPKFSLEFKSYSGGALVLAFLAIGLTALFHAVPGLDQFAVKTDNLSLVASVVAVALVLPERKWMYSVVALALFGANLFQSFISGWKEDILVPLILLGALLYPQYKKPVIVLGSISIVFLLFVLPFFTNIIREQSWQGQAEATTAALEAFETLQNASSKELADVNWNFLVFRFSEISNFVKYMENVPANRPFYDWQIIDQGFLNILPRTLFPDKPNMEAMVMERVLENGIIEWYSVDKVSAKPQLVVDGYLSFGMFGSWLFCFLIGLLSAFSSVVAERWFGGYLWGTGLIYTGLFQVFWRGSCWEFIINIFIWSFILMVLLFVLFRGFGFLKKVS